MLNGKTHTEIAGIKIEGQNKWIILIQKANRLQLKDPGEIV